MAGPAAHLAWHEAGYQMTPGGKLNWEEATRGPGLSLPLSRGKAHPPTREQAQEAESWGLSTPHQLQLATSAGCQARAPGGAPTHTAAFPRLPRLLGLETQAGGPGQAVCPLCDLFSPHSEVGFSLPVVFVTTPAKALWGRRPSSRSCFGERRSNHLCPWLSSHMDSQLVNKNDTVCA